MKVKQNQRQTNRVQLKWKGYARLYLRFNYTENWNEWRNDKEHNGEGKIFVMKKIL